MLNSAVYSETPKELCVDLDIYELSTRLSTYIGQLVESQPRPSKEIINAKSESSFFTFYVGLFTRFGPCNNRPC